MNTYNQKFYPTKWEAAANANCKPLEKLLFVCGWDKNIGQIHQHGFAYSDKWIDGAKLHHYPNMTKELFTNQQQVQSC